MPAPPTILQVLPALESGGVERGTVEIAQAVAAAGGVALVASAGGRMVPQLERAGGRHVSMALMTKDPVNILYNSFALGRLIRRERVTLVHARSRAPAWSAYWAAQRTGVPFVTTWHGVYDTRLPGKGVYNSVMAKGDLVIAISRYVADRLRALRVPASRIRLIPRGVDTALFSPGAVTGDRVHRLSQAWRLPPGVPVVMLPGRLTTWKGGELLLDAMARSAARDAFCVFVGAGDGNRLLRRARKLGITERIRLAGQCDDMAAAMMLADVVVCPSLKPEPFGRTVVEAQAMGRLVIAADHGGAAETVVAGTGWRVPPNDSGALAAAIDSALGLPDEERANVAEAAQIHVQAHYTMQAMQRATLSVYAELLD
jgi:glycosyltransferase involved in cell wall biosynthesis